MQKNTIDKYLENYAEKESHGIDCFLRANDRVYQYIVVIPICNEADDCVDCIFSETDKNLSVLIILVVNSPESNKNPEFVINNDKFIKRLKNKSSFVSALSNNCRLLNFTNNFDVLLVDRSSQGLANK